MSDDDGFDRDEYKQSRRRDPDTSKRAIRGRTAKDIRKAIIGVMRAANQPMTAEAINARVPVDGQSGNPRYNELMEEGLICTDGGRGENRSGKEAVLWRLATRDEGVFLRKQSAGGFPASDAFATELSATPGILDEIWPYLNRKQRRAYNGYIRKEYWEKYKKKGIKAFMRALGEDYDT